MSDQMGNPNLKETASSSETEVAAHMEALYRAHHALVFRAAYRTTGSASDAEDVLQTVFLRLLRRPDTLLAVDGAEGYLHRAAVNASLDVLRARRRVSDANPDGEDTRYAPDRLHYSEEIRQWLREAVSRLNRMEAEVVVLRFFEGKPNHEIAELLGTTAGTVAVALHRARKRLQREFEAITRWPPQKSAL